MFSFTDHVDALTEREKALQIVGDLMERGHYFPDSVTNLREVEPRPTNETGKFFPGQRVAFLVNGEHNEHVIADVELWYEAEAEVIERPFRAIRGERIKWRLSELTPGMIRVTLTFSANYGPLERLSKGGHAKKFWRETLKRLKTYLQDRRSYSGANTFAPRAPSREGG
ncbi:MAG: hypothetical protein IH851_03885 [Armatimonadetes bacterium]|nr:hypothetical protein [Armatimonadota bacterium]